MELRTEKLIKDIQEKYPTFTPDQVIALVQAEALLRMADEGINLYLNDCDNIPVEIKGALGICSQ